MQNKFNEIFEVSGPFRREALEDAILQEYGQLRFFCSTVYLEEDIRILYTCQINLALRTLVCYSSTHEAFIGLFLENSSKLKNLVKHTYKEKV